MGRGESATDTAAERFRINANFIRFLFYCATVIALSGPYGMKIDIRPAGWPDLILFEPVDARINGNRRSSKWTRKNGWWEERKQFKLKDIPMRKRFYINTFFLLKQTKYYL